MEFPVDDVLGPLCAALTAGGAAVLQAPPGAGKTTRVPLALLQEPELSGRILMLEPRRVAARAAAARMADTLGEPLGKTVGYRIRGEAKTSPATRIEVVTEGILTRMLHSDPDLPGIACVIFDEFHERSIHADLGLALCLDVRDTLREDLRLLVMSATLDAAPVAALMGDVPVLTSDGRAFPVETRHAPRPQGLDRRSLPGLMAETIRRAMADHGEGNLLAFLPGVAEIAATERALGGMPGIEVLTLHGGLPFKAQQAALIAPAPGTRRIVLATSLAETSLTLPDIRVVVDSGWSRRARFDAGSGMSRLVTERVSRAEADQRRGRAGRVAPGLCYRLWSRGEEGALPAFPPAEIEAADLAPLALDLAVWGGAGDGRDLRFLTPPPGTALAEANALLAQLGAIGPEGRITPHGRALGRVPCHPRLAHMLLTSKGAAPLAALLSGPDIVLRRPGSRAPADLGPRLLALTDPARFRRERPDALNEAALATARKEAARLRRFEDPDAPGLSPGAMLSLAYPDRIAGRRPGPDPRFLLSGGKGVALAQDDPLATQPFLVVADHDGDPTEAMVRLALPVSETDLRQVHGEALQTVKACVWSRRERRVLARTRTLLGALALEEKPWRGAPPDAIAAAATDGVRHLGLGALGWSAAARGLVARVNWVRSSGAEVPDLSEAALMETLETWLTPHLATCLTAQHLAAFDPHEALRACLDWATLDQLERLAPERFTAPTGTRVRIDYGAEGGPVAAIRLQEMFGLTRHPTLGANRVPLRLQLLSPAARPVQLTSDLPGFWATSYADVRKDMRGRYPRHPWPEDPAEALPTRRVKARAPDGK